MKDCSLCLYELTLKKGVFQILKNRERRVRNVDVGLPTRRIPLPRWALAIMVVNVIVASSDVMLPIGLGVFALLFNIAQGKLLEGVIVGVFAFCVMVFLMHIAMIRRMDESNELQQFVDLQMHTSALCRQLGKVLAVLHK